MPPRRKPPASAPPAALRAAVAAAAKEKEKQQPIKECPEWQLRPVYELVDKWENKAALSAIAKLLKKYPRSQVLRALAALSHLRLGETEVAYATAHQVVDEQPQELVVLQTLMFTLRPLGKVHDIVSMYQSAYAANPGDEELANHLFMAHVRALDFAAAQAMAVKCKQKFGTSSFKYAHWYALLTFMQAQATADPEERQLLLDVAVRQLGTVADKGGVQTYEHLVLYLDVLKAAKVASPRMRVDAINMHLERIPHIKEERWRLLLEHLDVKEEGSAEEGEGMSTDDVQLAVKVVSEVLEANPDDWFAWCKYLDAATSLSMSSTQIADFISRMQTIAGDRDRGAYLVPLELAHRSSTSDPDAFLTLWSKFGHKPVFYADVEPYLAAYSDLVAQQIEHEVQPTPKSAARGANLRKMRRYLGLDSIESGVLEALEKEYEAVRELDVDLLPTEPRHADDFLLLAVLYLLDGPTSPTHAFQSIALLETGVNNSPSNCTFKLLLLSLYLHVGAPSRASMLFESLEIKQIQLDTQSHHLMDRLGSLGAFDPALQLALHVQGIYNNNMRETPEQLIEAFHRGALTKVPEFREFYRRLDTSVNRSVALLEHWRWDVLRSHAPQPRETVRNNTPVIGPYDRVRAAVMFSGTRVQEPESGEWADNRDVSVVPTFRPSGLGAWQVPEKATKAEREHVRALMHVQRVVRATFELPGGNTGDSQGSDVHPLETSLDTLVTIAGGDQAGCQALPNELVTVIRVVERLGRVVQLTTTADDQAAAAKSYFTDAVSALTALLAAIDLDSPRVLSARPLRQLTSVLEASNLALVLAYLHPHIFAHECAMHPPAGLTWLADPFRAFLSDLQTKVLDPLADMLARVRDALVESEVEAMDEAVDAVKALSAWSAHVCIGDDKNQQERFPRSMWKDWGMLVAALLQETKVKQGILQDICKEFEAAAVAGNNAAVLPTTSGGTGTNAGKGKKQKKK